MINITIPGEPVPMARPRVVHFGRKVRTFNPRRMVNYERYARVEAMKQYKGKPLSNEPITISIVIYKKIPKSWSKKKKARMDHCLVRTRPDLDNYCKSLIDSFIGVLYDDDNLMAHLEAWELYSTKPRVEFSTWPESEPITRLIPIK